MPSLRWRVPSGAIVKVGGDCGTCGEVGVGNVKVRARQGVIMLEVGGVISPLAATLASSGSGGLGHWMTQWEGWMKTY